MDLIWQKGWDLKRFLLRVIHAIITIEDFNLAPNIRLPHPDCLMIKELEKGALDRMSGFVDYSFYETLHEG